MENPNPFHKRDALAIAGVSNYIYQPNSLTNAHYDYTLIQERIMNAVIYFLQDAIRIRMQGGNYKQLELFKENTSNDIIIEIPSSEISSKQQYNRVREACKLLAGQVVVIPYYDQNNKEQRIKYTGLFRADFPVKQGRTSIIRLEIDPKVAKILVEIELNDQKKAINYTKFHYDMTRKATKKCTPRVYKLLCSWRVKGSFIISVDEFKRRLGLENKYKYYRDLKKYILKPVQEDLVNMNADCRFDCESERFTIKAKNIVTHLNFQVISPEFFAKKEMQRALVIQGLIKTYHFDEDSLKSMSEIIANNDPLIILNKLDYLNKYINNSIIPIKDVKSYVIKALNADFSS